MIFFGNQLTISNLKEKKTPVYLALQIDIYLL